MTTVETDPKPAPTTTPKTWIDTFADLQPRFPGTKDSILFCVHALENDAAVELDDLKARASAHGIRVTAASLAAARRLLDPNQASPATSKAAGSRKGNRGRPARPRAGDFDPEALIRGVVEKIEQSRNAEADRLRECIRKAIQVLEASVAG